MKRGWPSLAMLGVAVCCGRMDATAQGAAKAARPSPQVVGQIQTSYTSRVQIISSELKPMLTKLWLTFDQVDALHDDLNKRRKHSDAAEEDEQRERLAKLKSSLREMIKEIRVDAKRLRALSPVPRSLRKADNELVDFSLEMEQALESLSAWVDAPSRELSLQSSRQLRKASTSFYNGLKAIGRLCDPAVKSKVYVDDFK